ncbi:HEAT repeat domain-containing protein [Micromonospora sp. NBC_01796]|uniref:HEAT repeat domain-containing protein n=1 Tax=Micromonospora sp. NBC_01796 TaxID=2975987 RepID=UPI002DD912A3|nr:HEAT repeat domain-containing protein [Micromonospora sp. NBC_01796]WSA85698.1 HEAT repeat domain-containing protein [Micromonospora sp. NBC_01796]
MNGVDVAELFDKAVRIARTVTCPEDYDGVWEVLDRAAGVERVAAELAGTQVTSPDATVRATACDLLGLVSERHEQIRASAATILISMADTEVDGDVHWSIARALGATCDPRAVPVLVTLARHDDSDVRHRVACSLPAVIGDAVDGPGVDALIVLSADPDREVRNWATFGLGWQTNADGDFVRQALWERTGDSYSEAREEGIRGLAKRRDHRALPLLAGLLAEASAHVFSFDAAAFLGDPALLPLLRKFDPADRGVEEALRECDPVLRARRDAFAIKLFDALHARLPEAEIALYAERFELGLHLEVDFPGSDGGQPALWSVEGLIERAGDDPDLAVQFVAQDLQAIELG